MKKITKKITTYTAAVGALLAVSGAANAGIIPGIILPGDDGDTSLDMSDPDDVVFIDINDDGVIDFYGYVWSQSSGSALFRSACIAGYETNSATYTNYIGIESFNNSINPFDPTYGWAVSKKYLQNDPIGPLALKNEWGMITYYSEGTPGPGPGPLAPPTAPFNLSNDQGYIGVSMVNGSSTNYGWIQIAIDEDGENVDFLAAASESVSNEPILAGSSATVPLLPIATAAGLGLIGLMAAMRKRRKIAQSL
jgi:hypothetical protein